MPIDRTYILRELLLVFASAFLFALIIIHPSIVYAATTVSDSFDNSDNISNLQGAAVSGGSLIMSSDNVTYSENFDSYSNGDVPTNWTRETTNWSVQDGKYNYATNAYDDSRTVWTGGSLKNGQVSADFTFLGGERMGSIMFRYQDDNNYYNAFFSTLYDSISFKKIVNGVSTTIANLSEDLDPATTYNLKVVFNGNKVQIYLDNVLKITGYDGDISNTGNVGIWRNGAGLNIDNFNVTSPMYDHGNATSTTTTTTDNIQSATLTLSGTNTSQIDVFASNDNGTNWQEITDGIPLYFTTSGTQFKYKIYLESGTSNPTIEDISFTLQAGSTDTLNTTIHPDLNMLSYNRAGNARIPDSASPSSLVLYDTIANTKMVQQAAIVRRNGATIAYATDSDNHNAFAYDLVNKTKLWEVNLGGYLESTPYVNNGVVYVGSYNKKMYALNQDTGETLWTYTGNDAISGGNVDIKNNIIYFVDYGYSGTTTLYAVNLTTHELVWSYPVALTTILTFTLDPTMDRIYVSHSGILFALTASTGTLVWKNDLASGYITRRPVVIGDELVIGADRGVAVVNKSTGATKWKLAIGTQTEDGVGAAPVVENGIMYYPTKNDAKLYARNISDGSLVWSVDAPASGTFSSPVLTSDGYIYLAYTAGIKAFNKADGSPAWTSTEPGWAENTVSIGHGYMLFTDPTGAGTMNIYRINKENYTSSNGLTLNRDERTITGITAGSIKSTGFTCDADQLTLTDTGAVTIDYGTYPDGANVPSNIILNPVSSTKIAVCRPSGTDTFTYPFGTDSMTDILRDGSVMSRSSWSKSGNSLTITDSFSNHTYEPTIVQSQTQTSNNNSTNNNTSGSSNNSSTGASTCGSTAPSTAPYAYSVVPMGKDSVLLKFTQAQDPVDKYVLQFGTKPGIYTYGLSNIGGRETRSFHIRFLKPGVNYYFRVRAGNGCAAGPWSNEIQGSTRGVSWASQSIPTVPQVLSKPGPVNKMRAPPVSNPTIVPINKVDDYKPVTLPVYETTPAPQPSFWNKLLHFFGF